MWQNTTFLLFLFHSHTILFYWICWHFQWKIIWIKKPVLLYFWLLSKFLKIMRIFRGAFNSSVSKGDCASKMLLWKIIVFCVKLASFCTRIRCNFVTINSKHRKRETKQFNKMHFCTFYDCIVFSYIMNRTIPMQFWLVFDVKYWWVLFFSLKMN